jgi:hypothetical protein
MDDVEDRRARNDLVLVSILEQQASRSCPRDVPQRVDAVEHRPHATLRARGSMRDELRRRVGSGGDEDERLDARLRCGHDRTQARAGAPAHLADVLRVDGRQRLQDVDGPSHRDDVLDG